MIRRELLLEVVLRAFTAFIGLVFQAVWAVLNTVEFKASQSRLVGPILL